MFEVHDKPINIFNGYLPQGEHRHHPVKFPAKAQFYRDLNAFIQSRELEKMPLVVMGDHNAAPQDADIGIGADNAKRWH